MFSTVRRTAAAVLVVAALSGCSLLGTSNEALPTATPTPTEAAETDQTAREACTALIPVLTDTNDRMVEAYDELQKSGPEAAAPLLHGISDDLRPALEDITNEEVLVVTTTFADSLDTLIAEMDALLADDGDPDALLAASGAVIDDFQAIGTVCRAAE
jgi:hypothetical protein